MKIQTLIPSLFILTNVIFAQNHTFPHNAAYNYGITVTNPDNERIQQLYSTWIEENYRENGDIARVIYPDTPDKTVSEGIAYGMMIMVYMENLTNQTQLKFNKLYNFYSKFAQRGDGPRKYLMAWLTDGWDDIGSYGDLLERWAATDADLDVALALILAHKQWGSDGDIHYIQEAENLLAMAYDNLIDENQLLIPGDDSRPGEDWDLAKNPSYFTTASIGLFHNVQYIENFQNTRDWLKVYSQSHIYLNNAMSIKGLFPDWTKADIYAETDFEGYAATSWFGIKTDFSWDACRTPWRIAWDYAWFGDTLSYSMMKTTADYGSTKDPATIKGPININTGEPVTESYHNAVFIGGVGISFMTSGDQARLDSWYEELQSRNEANYYSPSLQLLFMLLMSGNSPNFYDVSTVEELISSSEIVDSSSSEYDNLSSSVNKESSERESSSSEIPSSEDPVYRHSSSSEDAFESSAESSNDDTSAINNEIMHFKDNSYFVIKKLQSENSIIIHPELPNKQYRVRVINVMGTTVFWKENNAHAVTLDISDYRRGVYFVEVLSAEESIIQKVEIE